MSVIEKKVEELRETFDVPSVETLKRMNYRLSDAIREGCSVTEKAETWIEGESVCAMSAAVIAAKARGYM